MDKEKFILQEEIKRIKELAGYDKSKTLMEQGSSADINMDRLNQQQLAQAPETVAAPADWRDNMIKLFPNEYTKTTMNNEPALLRQYPNSQVYYTKNRWFQYTKDGKTLTIKGSWRLDGNKINAVKDAAYNQKPATTETPETPATPATAKTPTSTAKTGTNVSQNIINTLTFDYTYPGDTKFVYSKKDNIWYGKNVNSGKVFNISKDYPKNAANLDKGAVQSQTTETPTTPTTPTTPAAPKKLTDMSSIELDIMKKNQPLDYKIAYDKLGAIEKKMVDDKATGK